MQIGPVSTSHSPRLPIVLTHLRPLQFPHSAVEWFGEAQLSQRSRPCCSSDKPTRVAARHAERTGGRRLLSRSALLLRGSIPARSRSHACLEYFLLRARGLVRIHVYRTPTGAITPAIIEPDETPVELLTG